MSWYDFLRYVGSPLGAGAAVGVLLSLLAEYWPEYDSLAPKAKRLLFALLCFLFPLASATLLALAGFVPWSWDPLYWDALQAGAAAFAAGTLVHTRALPTGAERDWQRRLGGD
jgi:hypothetical protein